MSAAKTIGPGVYTALITPFNLDKTIDWVRFSEQIETQIAGGVRGLVPAGTTGESPTLTTEEHKTVIRRTVEYAKGRVLVIAGTGANSTAEAIELTKAAEDAGADASLQVAPYYNKPTQEGLFQHFREIARATRLPIVLYNIPSRCGVEIAVSTVVRLVGECQEMIGIKEAGGSCDRVSELRLALGSKFLIFSGDDSLTLPFMSLGANGVISVASNLIPAEIVRMVEAELRGDFITARQQHLTYFPFFKALFLETNPSPVKCAMNLNSRDSGQLRLPLVPVGEKTRAAIVTAVVSLGVISTGRTHSKREYTHCAEIGG